METENVKKFYIDQPLLKGVLADKDIPSSAKLLLLYLVYRLGGKSYAFPSQKTIAKELGLSERQVRNLVKHLKDKGIIDVARGAINPKTGNMVNSNSYDLSSLLIS